MNLVKSFGLWSIALNRHSRQDGVFSASLKRAAQGLQNAFREAGLPEDISAVFDGIDEKKTVQVWELQHLKQRATEFETVLANELPGLAIYFVPQRGIYSTDDLIAQADIHIPQKQRNAVPIKGREDVVHAGRCLAFELPTASAFHVWRAVETMMDRYHWALTDKTFKEAGVTRNWGQYIPALKTAGADTKITVFLEHIKGAYRNPISHPEDTLEYDDAFNLFSTALSAIGQMAKAVIAAKPMLEESSVLAGLLVSAKNPEDES